MQYLDKEQIAANFSMEEAIAACKEALELYSAGRADIPLRTNIDVPENNGQALFMPGYVSGSTPALGIKIVSVFPDNIKANLPSVPATMLTMDAKTGIVNAVLDGTFLTQLRTGAVQGAATDLLARKDAKIGLLIGTGGQGFQQLRAMLTVRNFEKMYIFDIDQARAQAFAKEVATSLAVFGVEFEAVADVNAVVGECDVITTVTTAKVPTFDGSLVKPGCHINGVGAYTLEMHELPETALAKAAKIFTDTNDGVLAEAGDVVGALEKGTITKEDLSGELGQLVSHPELGRQSAKDITVFKTVGTSALDVVVADKIVRKIQG